MAETPARSRQNAPERLGRLIFAAMLPTGTTRTRVSAPNVIRLCDSSMPSLKQRCRDFRIPAPVVMLEEI